jgi:hypothetical protein
MIVIMADQKSDLLGAAGSDCFKEAICINAERIYDSCSDKDCLDDLQVYFTSCNQPIIDNALSVKCRKVKILNIFVDVDKVPFNQGFFSVDITFFFELTIDAYSSPSTCPVPTKGLAIFTKKVILFGSEGNVKTFTSADNDCSDEHRGSDADDRHSSNGSLPTAIVQAVDPICLALTIGCESSCRCDTPAIPTAIANFYDGKFDHDHDDRPEKIVRATLGVFSIVQLVRKVQMLIPAYDFCIPDKECESSVDDPCELFKKIKFPINEFFPPKLDADECD